MDMLTVGGEDRSSADEAADHRQDRFENRQAEGDYRNRDRNDGRRLLRTIECEGAEQETNQQAARVTQKDGRRIEVVAQKSQNRTCEGDGHDFDQCGPMQEGHRENDHRGKQSGSSGQTVETVDQVKGIGDCQNPDDRDSETNVPGEDTVAEKYGYIHDAQTT